MDPENTTTEQAPDQGGTMVTDSASFFAKAFEGLSLPEDKPAETAPEAPQETPEAPAEPAPEAPKTDLPDFNTLDLLKKSTEKSEKTTDEEIDPDDDSDMPEDVKKSTPKAQNSWRDMKKIIKERTREARELQRQLEEEKAKKLEADPEEIAAIKSKLEEKEKALFASQVQATDEYREAVEAPLEKIRDRVKALSEKREIPVRDIMAAISEPDPDKQEELLSEVASNLTEFERIRFYELAKEHSRLDSVKQRILANSKEAWERIENHRKDNEFKQKEQFNTQLNKALDQTWQSIQERVPLFREQEGNEAWNNTIREIDTTARSLKLDELPPEGRALVAYRACIAPVATKMLFDLYTEHQKVVGELEKIRGATPRAGATDAPSTETPSGIEPTASFQDVIRQSLGG
jgi:hypothetical protein